jgi:hypothetical protein
LKGKSGKVDDLGNETQEIARRIYKKAHHHHANNIYEKFAVNVISILKIF